MRSIFFLLVYILVAHTAISQPKIPPHGGFWVHDEAHVLSADAIASLEAFLKSERDSTSNQIAILIVPSLEGGDISDYAVHVFEEWKLGQAKKDNGALFLISIQDRKMRIEVGRGLEGVLTDAMSGRINRNEVAPYFRKGDYDNGIKAGVLAIVQVIKGEYKNDAPPQRGKRSGKMNWGTLIFIIILVIIMSRRRGGGSGGMGYWAAGSLLGGGFGGSSSSWGSGSDFGGGGMSGGGGSSDSW